jgi:uncharacterized protein YndB with AHSA1/START domain
MPSAENRVTIHRPVEDVYRYVARGENGAEWRGSVVDARLRSGTEGESGAVYEQRVSGPFGRPVSADYEIVSAAPNRELRFRAISGPVRPEGYYLFESDGANTTVTFGLTCEPSGLAKLMSPMVQKAMNGEVAALAKLKDVLER